MPEIVDAAYLQGLFPDNEQNLIQASNARDAMAHLATSVQTVQDAVDVLGVNPDGSVDLTALVAQLNNLQASVDANTAQVALNTAAVADHAARLAVVEATVADHETRISTLELSVAQLEIDVPALQADVTQLQADVGAAQADIIDLQARVTNVETDLASIPGLGFTIFVSETEPPGAVDGDVWIQPEV